MKPDWQLEWEAEQRAVLAGATFSVFAPEGLPLELSSWGGGDGEPVDSVGLRQEAGEDRWVDVDSGIAEDGFSLPDAKRDAASLLGAMSDAPVEVAPEPRPLRVDGLDVPFAFARAGARWIAIGAVGDVTITVQAQGLDADDLHLRGLADPVRLVDAEIPETGRADQRVACSTRVGSRSSRTRRRSRTSGRRWPGSLEVRSPCW